MINDNTFLKIVSRYTEHFKLIPDHYCLYWNCTIDVNCLHSTDGNCLKVTFYLEGIDQIIPHMIRRSATFTIGKLEGAVFVDSVEKISDNLYEFNLRKI